MDAKAVSSAASILILIAIITSLWFLSTNANQIGDWIQSGNSTLVFSDILSVRDNLKTLLQMQATVIAIIISLSLASVQLAASTYSLRLFRSFTTNPWIWTLTILYLGSIALDLSLLTLLTQSTVGYERYIAFSYILGFLMPFLILPYLRTMTGILSPEVIVQRLAKEMAKSPAAYQSIDDVICISISKNDYETARIGLKEMNAQILAMVKSHDLQALWDNNVPRGSRKHIQAMTTTDVMEDEVRRYCRHLERLGKLFLKKEEEELALHVIEDLSTLGHLLAEKAYPIDFIKGSSVVETENILKTSATIGSEAAERRAYNVVKNTLERMVGIAKSIKYKDEPTKPLIEFGRDASPEDAVTISYYIGELGDKAIQVFGFRMLGIVVKSLKEIGILYATKKLDWATSKATRYLFEISARALSEHDYYGNVSDTILSADIPLPLTEIGKISHENKLEHALEKVTWGLWTIGVLASQKGLSRTKEDCAQGLAELRKLDQKKVDTGFESFKFWNKGVETTPHYDEFRQEYYNKLAKESGEKGFSRGNKNTSRKDI